MGNGNIRLSYIKMVKSCMSVLIPDFSFTDNVHEAANL